MQKYPAVPEDIPPEISRLLSASTVRADLPIIVDGAFSESGAAELATTLLLYLQVFGGIFDLSALDGVSVYDDYVSGLASVDRGYPGMGAPTPTNDAFGQGFAMAVPVLRSGAHKSHIVFKSALVRPLVETNHPQYKFAVHSVCHECTHVYDMALQSKALPDFYGKPLADFRDGIFYQLALSAWNEYAASRLSAPWGTPNYCDEESKILCAIIRSAVERGNDIKLDFIRNRDAAASFAALAEVFGGLFARASYLVGHLDGIEGRIEDQAPEISNAIASTTWLRPLWEDYLAILRDMFARHGQWSSLDIFDRLINFFEHLMARCGARLERRPTGEYYAYFEPTTF